MASSNDSRVNQALMYLATAQADTARYKKIAATADKNYKKLGSSSSSGSSSGGYTPKAGSSAAARRTVNQKNPSEQQRGDSLSKLMKSTFGGTLGGIVAASPGAEIAKQITEKQDVAQHPKNLAQQIMNTLSTGTYATANAVDAAAHALNEGVPQVNEKRDSGDILGAYGAAAKTLGNVNAGVVGGAARGVAEGLGNRFDGRKPLTMGQNLEHAGTKKVLENALGKEHGDFAQGLLGGGADIATDPTTYLTFGLTGAAKGVLKGAVEGAKAGESTAGSVVRGVAGGAKGAVAGAAARRAEIATARSEGQTAVKNSRAFKSAIRSDTKDMGAAEKTQYLKDVADKKVTPTGYEPVPSKTVPGYETPIDPKVGIAREAAPEPAAARLDTPEAAPAELARVTDEAPVAESLAKLTSEDPRAAGIAGLLPKIVGSTGKRINATAIARDTMGPAGMITTKKTSAAVANKIRDAVNTPHTTAEWRLTERDLRRDPAVAKVLDQPAAGGGKLSVAEVARRAATNEGGAGRFRPQLDEALRTGASKEYMGAGTLHEMIDEGGFGQVFDTPRIAAELGKLPLGPRKTAIRQLLAPSTRKSYQSFDEALYGAVKGEIPSSMMRTMLKRLGVDSKAANPKQLRDLLGKAKTDWEAIKATIRTPQEVLDIHGVDDAAMAASNDVDAAAAMTAAAARSAEETEKAIGFNPSLIEPRTGEAGGSSIGTGLWAMAEAGARHLAGKVGDHTETYDNTMMVIKHRALVNKLAKHSTMAKLSGAERADALTDNWVKAMQLDELHNLGLGQMARIVNADSPTDPLFVSMSQIADNMDRGVLGRALFGADMQRATFSREKIRDFTAGFTLYPNVIADGVRQAVKGATPEQVAGFLRKTMLRHSPSIGTTMKDFDGAVRAVADDVTRADFLEKIKGLDAHQAPIAVAISRAAADGLVQPLAARITDLVARGAELDRGALITGIRKALAESRTEARSAAGYPSLTEDMVTSRMDSGFINGILGEHGSHLLSADERMRAAAKVETMANGGVRRTQAHDPVRELEAQNAARGENIDDNMDLIDEVNPVEDPRVDLEEHLSNIASKNDLIGEQNGLGKAGIHLGVALEGTFGMGAMKKSMVVSGQTFTYNVAAGFTQGLRRFIEGGRTRGLGVKTPGLMERLGQELGVGKASYDQVKQAASTWWDALAAAPVGATDDELRAFLRVGVQRNPRAGIATSTQALSDGEIEMALDLKKLIDQVFDESGAGLFVRSGLDSREVLESLGRYKEFKQGGAYAGHTPNKDESFAMQAGIWRSMGEADDKFDLLDKYFTAMSAASLKPSIGASMSKQFGMFNPSAADIARLKLTKLNTTNPKGDLQRYVDPNAYWTPEDLKQLSYVQNLLNTSRSFNAALNPTVKIYDALTHVLKSSATIWRPGHHVTNLLGDMGANLMAGVNPLYAVRGMKMMHAGNMLADADLGPLSELKRLLPEHAGQVADPKHFGDYAYINVGGRIEMVDLTTLFSQAQKMGVAMSHAGARDILAPVSHRINPGGIEKAQRAIGFRQTDEGLGKVSAIRDNLTRLPQFLHELEHGKYKSLSEAYERAAVKVHESHPTSLNITPFESKYMRRAFYFYNWTRQMSATVIRTGLDRPGLVTIPSKMQFEMAQANGLNPESIGQPIDPDNENMASYATTSLLGPTFFGGLSPTQEGDNSWGYSLSSPQMDTLISLFDGANTVPGASNSEQPFDQVTGGAKNVLVGNLNPLIRTPLEFGFRQHLTGSGAPIDTDAKRTKYLADQTGVFAGLAKSTGLYSKMFPNTYKTPEENGADASRAWLNLLTGAKFTNYDDGTSAAVAKSERSAAVRRATTK